MVKGLMKSYSNLPLSPRLRVPASPRPIFLSRFYNLHARLNLGLGNKRGPVGDYLFDFRATTCKACDSRRPGENQRRYLFRESLDCAAVVASDADAQLHFCQVWRWSSC